MPKLSQAAAIELALVARGETKVDQLARWNVYTRKWLGRRDHPSRTLRECHETQKDWKWYVSRRGPALRVGPTSTESRPVQDDVYDALVKEGRAIAAK